MFELLYALTVVIIPPSALFAWAKWRELDMPRTAADAGKPDIRIHAHTYGNPNGVELTACTLDGARWLSTLTDGAVHFFPDDPRTFAPWTPAREQALRQSGLLVSDGRPRK